MDIGMKTIPKGKEEPCAVKVASTVLKERLKGRLLGRLSHGCSDGLNLHQTKVQ
jgi:hypothetical protein